MCVQNSPCRSLLFPWQRRQKNLIAFDGAVMNGARELVGV
jgi:hypothetical protein